MNDLSQADLDLISSAVCGLFAALSEAGDSGLAGALREHQANAEALAALPAAIRGAIIPPQGLTWGPTPSDLPGALRAAREVVARALPEERVSFDAALLYLGIRCAAAAEGTSVAEKVILSSLREALDLPCAADPT